jgi:hypothetical protein
MYFSRANEHISLICFEMTTNRKMLTRTIVLNYTLTCNFLYDPWIRHKSDTTLKGFRHHFSTQNFLNFSYMNIVSTIPLHVENLSFLGSLSIENNSFHDSLHNELSHLYWLQHLSFGFDNFIGEIPWWMVLLSKLHNLPLNGNSFTGDIPPSQSNISCKY